MGAIYLQNDREDVTANLVLRLFKSKLTLSTNGGIQRNNLDKKQISTMYRVIALLNAMYVINDKWSLIGTYSNFNSNSIINTAPLGVNVDSLRYFQVTNSYSGTVNYATGNNRIKHVYTINSTYQKASDPYTSGSAFYASNASYQFQLIPKNLTITTSVNFNQNSFSGQQYRAYGPGVTLQKYYLNKRIRALAAMSYILNENYGTNGTTMNNRLGCAYRAGDHHLFSVDLNWLKNTSSKTLNYTFNEYRGGLTYTLSF
jgi:hypothetical protein